MARIQLSSVPDGVFQDDNGTVQVGVSATILDISDNPAVVYADSTGGTTTTPITDADGGLVGYVDPGRYTITVGAKTKTIDAVDAGQAKVVAEAPLNPMYPEYGAKWDGVTDDSAAMNAVIAALPVTGNDETTGGEIQLPPGDGKMNASIIADGLKNVTIRGYGARYGGSRILVNHTGNGISAKSAGAFTLEKVALANTSGTYAGKLIDVSGTSINPANFPSLRDVRLDMAAASGITGIGVDANFTINFSYEHGYVTGGGKGIRGCQTNSDFLNVPLLRKVYFSAQDIVQVHNLGCVGAGGKIEDCTFEPLRSGAAGAYLQDATIPFGGPLVWLSNYAGDGNGSGTWITFNGYSLIVLSDFEDALNTILLNGETRSLAVGGWLGHNNQNGINFNGQTVRSFRDLGLHGKPPMYSGTSLNFGAGGGMASGSVGVQLNKTATQSITSGSATAISWDAANFDTLGTNIQWAIGTPTRIVCKVPGLYRLSATAVMAASTGGDRAIWFRVNGSTWLPGWRGAPNPLGTGVTGMSATTLCKLNAGDYVECYVQQTSGGALNILTSDGGLGIPTSFDMGRVG